MESMSNNLDYLKNFEFINNYQLPDYLKSASAYNDLIHLNQLNDIKNEEFNHICYIGNYSTILQTKQESLKNKNSVFRNFKNQVFLTKNLGKEEFKPVHTPFSFPCKIVSSFDDVYNGLIIFDTYYILVNTDDDNLRYNVYSLTKNTCKDTKCEYLFFVLLGKIVNPVPYLESEVEDFENKYNLKLDENIKSYLTTQAKTIVLKIDNIQKIFYFNLNSGEEYLGRQSLLRDEEESFDLENFRKPLFKLWEKNLLDEEVKEEEVLTIRKNINDKIEHFFDGFLKIGTLVNENYKNIGILEKTEHKLVVEVYILLNCSQKLKGSLWIYQIDEPGNATINEVHYLQRTKFFKIGTISNV